jgi:hypothetical protein
VAGTGSRVVSDISETARRDQVGRRQPRQRVCIGSHRSVVDDGGVALRDLETRIQRHFAGNHQGSEQVKETGTTF